jgi:hypothetical protein
VAQIEFLTSFPIDPQIAPINADEKNLRRSAESADNERRRFFLICSRSKAMRKVVARKK